MPPLLGFLEKFRALAQVRRRAPVSASSALRLRKSMEELDKDSPLACLRCSKPAHFRCPKCLDLKLPWASASFCSQDCFRAAWSTHKVIHAGGLPEKSGSDQQVVEAMKQGWQYCLRKGSARASEIPFFDWTGALRPYPISPRRLVPNHIRRPDWSLDGVPKEEPASKWQNSVEIKSQEQIQRMRETCKVAREVLDAAARAIKPGVTTDDIDRVVHDATIAAGGYPSPLNYHFFPKSCCTSVNEVICHGIPDARRLEEGDIVNVDVSVYLNGCHGDLNETFFVGQVDEASVQLVKSTYECLEKAIAIVKPGVRYREVGDVISRHAAMTGLSVVKSYCGHGIGELFHCAPNIPHYGHNKAVGTMKAGQIFTIEPMINRGIWRDRMWPDGWTAATADGKRSAQFEHTLLVTENGVEVLTARLPSSPSVFPWLLGGSTQ
ncbi:methionine aminopeptidase 1A isoform X1 [Selaginella moellendorffii]|nr:methionine aminopeptidase 1A isoform X1 [Selaginella moellendorffii]|eukprot:XP_002977126.2 methionine aminopeptidase 1A isoform X1 [Selaginella moellendorffii]